MAHREVGLRSGTMSALSWALVLACNGEGGSRFDGVDDGPDPTVPEPVDTAVSSSTTLTGPNTNTTGDAEHCVILFGGNDRIRGADEGLPVEDDPRTLQAWIRTRSLDEQVAVSHGRPSPGQGFQLGTVDGLPMARVGSGNDVVVGEIAVADDEWHHLAASFDGRLVVLMVDGEVAGSGDLETWTIEGDVVAGNTPTGDLSKPWVGWLDDVRIFRGARPPDDVAADPDGGAEAERNLELWWDFEQPETAGLGVTVEDLSGNGHHGTTGGTEGSPSFSPCR
jgi:hypothetical protein